MIVRVTIQTALNMRKTLKNAQEGMQKLLLGAITA
jgi:hypothetical protein